MPNPAPELGPLSEYKYLSNEEFIQRLDFDLTLAAYDVDDETDSEGSE